MSWQRLTAVNVVLAVMAGGLAAPAAQAARAGAHPAKRHTETQTKHHAKHKRGVKPPAKPVISVLSNRADLISGGEALVSVKLPAREDARKMKMRLGRRNVSSEFAQRANGQYEGLLTGLTVGKSTSPRRSRTAPVPRRRSSTIRSAERCSRGRR